MILIDTSVWVGHLRSGDSRLQDLLEQGLAVTHPFVIGELACGNLSNRSEILSLMRELPAAVSVEEAEVHVLVERHRLWGRGIGWIDAHLLASALLTRCRLWTLDRRLRAAAVDLKVHSEGA